MTLHTFCRYVRHDRINAYAAVGWRVVDTLAGTHHGAHAVIMEWVGHGEPPKPGASPCETQNT